MSLLSGNAKPTAKDECINQPLLISTVYFWPIMDEYGNIIAVAVAKLDVKTIIKDYGVVPENTNFGVKASAVRNLMEGNGVKFKVPNTEVISKQDLSRNATEGTVYLTCWMTMAQVERLRTQKVMFEHLE